MTKSSNFIKNIKPRKNSYYHQCMVDPKKFHKCKEKDPVIARSGLEMKFIQYCENQSTITGWVSEALAIPYFNRLDKKTSNYYPDFIIQNQDGHQTIVEVKPYAQTKKPRPQDSLWLKQQWIKNCDKWKAAMSYAKEHNMKFILVTEKFFE